MHSQQMFNECIAGHQRCHKDDGNFAKCSFHLFCHTGLSRKGSYLPAAHAEEESHHIGLLLLVKFLDIFEGTHLVGVSG